MKFVAKDEYALTGSIDKVCFHIGFPSRIKIGFHLNVVNTSVRMGSLSSLVSDSCRQSKFGRDRKMEVTLANTH